MKATGCVTLRACVHYFAKSSYCDWFVQTGDANTPPVKGRLPYKSFIHCVLQRMLKKRNKICSSFDNYLLDILYNNFPFVFVLGEYRVSENKVSFSLSLLALRIVKQLA